MGGWGALTGSNDAFIQTDDINVAFVVAGDWGPCFPTFEEKHAQILLGGFVGDSGDDVARRAHVQLCLQFSGDIGE